MKSVFHRFRIMRAERAVGGAVARPAKSVLPAVLLKSLVLAAAVGSAPAAVGQSEARFDPAEITVKAGESGTVSVINFPDRRPGGGGPGVRCDVGSFRFTFGARGIYAAPPGTAATEDQCLAEFEGRALATLRVIILDITAPVPGFDPSEISVSSGATAASTLTATDNVAVTGDPEVTCSHGGAFDVATNTYTAPVVSVDTTDTCTATALDAAGNAGRAILTVSIAKETTPPVVTFTPAELSVLSGATVPVTLTATDNVGVTRVWVASCTQGSFDLDTNTYTAPSAVRGSPRVVCQAAAEDAAGNRGSAVLTVHITSTTPGVRFTPQSLTVLSGATVPVTLTATDYLGNAITPTVSCSRGSFNVRDNTYTAPVVEAYRYVTCGATASDTFGNTASAGLVVFVISDRTPPTVTFTPATLVNVASGATVPVTLTATDSAVATDLIGLEIGGVPPLHNLDVTGVRVTCTQGSLDPDTDTYTAPVVSVDTADTCTATARDAVGNTGTATLTVSVAKETVAPEVSFSPASLTVVSGATVASTFTATDNVGITTGPDVTCTQGSFNPDTNTYTAPVVSIDTADTCTATASDAAGNTGTATLTVSVTGDREPPQLSFSLEEVAVGSGQTVTVTLTAMDNVGITTGPAVTCTHGSFDPGTNTYTAPGVRADTADTCTATARDAAGNTGTATLTVSIAAPDTEPPVLAFTPNTLTVASGGTVESTFTATDNMGITRGPVVSCSRDQGFFNINDNTYTAPRVNAAIRVPCTARAFDAAGNRGVARLWVSVVPDRTPPVLTFSPAALALDAGATVAVTFTATDNVGIVRGGRVRCTAGSFSVGNNTYTAPDVSVDTTATCTATAADAAGNESTATLAVSVSAPGDGPDMTRPVLTFSPASLTVSSGATVAVTFAATDNVGIVRGGRSVRCKAGSFSVMNNTYTAPAVREAVRDVCRAVAYDAAGNAGRAKLVVFVINPDRRRPVLTFRPNPLTVDSGTTASVAFTATDNAGITRGPVVTCYPGSFSVGDNTYTAPDVSVDTGAGCKARAYDAAGNRGAANLKVSITAPVEPATSPEPPVTAPPEPPVTPPVVSFSPVSLTLASGGTGLSQVTATDADNNALTPTVSCTNGGSYDVGTGVFTAPTVTKNTFSICTAMATDGDGNTGSAMLAVNITPPPSSPPASCPDGFTESSGSPLGDKTLCTGPLGNLSEFGGVLTQSATIPYVEGVAYELSGRLDVGQAGPATCAGVNPWVILTIEAGVTIVGDSGDDVLVVNRCHRIEAAGTSEAPIVLTSKNDIAGTGDRARATGEWGGVVVLGHAPINRCNNPGATGGTSACENTVAGVSSPAGVYGGGNGGSDSGTLEYVTVRHAGAGLNAGLTLGGVGIVTTVDHIQVHNSSGDGMRLLGGRVQPSSLVLTGNTDDGLDIDSGYSDIIEEVVGVQRSGGSSDSGIEVRSVAPGVKPDTAPSIRNFTLLAAGSTKGSGLRVTAGARPAFYDGIVVDGNTCLDYETTAGDGVQGYSESSDPTFRSVLFDCPDLVTTDTGNGDDPTTGRAAIDFRDRNPVTSNTLDGFIPGETERGVEPFLTGYGYIGAFSPEETDTNNWTTGWTRDLPPPPVCPEGTADAGFDMFGHNVCNVSGTVTDDLILARGNLYALQGRVDIGIDMGGVDMGADGTAAGGNAAALVIEPGVTVFGRSGMDHMVVNRGSTITAEGTEADPIIFTSVQDVTGAGGNRLSAAGEWGGLIILGRAPINFCNDPDATGGTAACERKEPGRGVDGLYGGAVSDDDSGSLRYVQVKYAGSGPATGFNPGGITFGGVGSETDVEYVQVYNAPGRGIGYFGGTVNSRRIVVTGSAIQLDIDHGYRGSLQYVIGVQGAGGGRSINVASARPGSSPASDPTVGNFTLMGADSARGSGIRVRRNAVGTWLNGIVTGGNACLDYEDGAGDGVEGFTPGSDPAFLSVLFDCAGGVLTGRGGLTGQEAVDADRNNAITPHTLEGFVNGTAEAAVPAAPVPRGNGFLEAVDYIGAVRDAEDTWWRGWTCGLEESDPC